MKPWFCKFQHGALGIHLLGALLWMPLQAAETNNSVPTQAAAEVPPLEEILVTADFRRGTLQSLGVSASVLDEAVINRRGAEHLMDLLGATANVNFSQGASRARYFQIRGIGERSQFAEPLNPSVGLLIDGIDFSGIGTVSTLFDVRQVEVLRGPQGTRFGANALAGLINVTTHTPSEVPEYRLRADFANYQSYGLGVIASGPIDDQFGYRLAIQRSIGNGFINNRVTGHDSSDRDETTVRARLNYRPSDHLAVDLAFGHIDIDNGYDEFSLDNDRRPSSDEPGTDQQRTNYLSATVNWSLEDFALLSLVAAGERSDIDYRYDEDWVFVGFHPDEYSSTDAYLRDRRSGSLDLRLQSASGARWFNNSTDWLVGVYHIADETELDRIYTFFDGPFTSTNENQRSALYGQLDAELSPRLSLSVGMRVEDRQGHYRDSEGLNFRPDEPLWGGNLVLGFYPSESSMWYASVARGYKAGGFNIKGTLPADLREFADEQLWSYELGIKGEWFAGRGRFRLALFDMQRDDMQVATTIERAIDAEEPTGPVEFIDFIGNAAAGSNRGFEFEGDFNFTDRLEASWSLGYLHSEYENFTNERGEVLDGRDQAHAPRYQGQVAFSYRPLDELTLSLEAEGKDAYFFDDSNNARNKAYGLMHIRVEYHRLGVKAALWARNVFDVDYAVRGFFFGNDPRIGYEDRVYRQLGEPRRIGITLSAEL